MTTNIVVQQPNEFTFTNGKGTFITYVTTSINGQPQLDYKTQHGHENHHFSGQEIDKLETAIGTLVTVVIERPLNRDIGGNLVKLTVLIPIINLPVTEGEEKVKTEAILTTEKVAGNIRIPLIGQIQTYEVLSLTGTARFVVS